MYRKTAKKLLKFIEKSPTAFQAVTEMTKRLDKEGFEELKEEDHWKLKKGGNYYVTRNHSAIIAFSIPQKPVWKFHIMASHSDSPAFKIKENPEMKVDGSYVKLNVEKYGGMLMAPWFDRPLSVAGRVVVKENGRLVEKLVNIERNLVMIPNLAIHMNREANNGTAYNPQKDMLPLFAAENTDRTLLEMIAEQVGADKSDILSHDLFLYNRMPGTIWGADREFVSSARLDDLQCAFSSMEGLLGAETKNSIAVHCVLDNEEVGSGTKQGADSDFLEVTLERLCMALGLDAQERYCIYSNSLLLSADNAHALHPNHPEKCDLTNRPKMNRGIVLKYHGAQKYTTDGYSSAFFIKLCKDNNIPYQTFLNRSDLAGGSTLGNISTAHVSIPSVDIGFAQLAMHSAVETAGRWDLDSGIELFTRFFQM